RKGSICICSAGFKGMITSDIVKTVRFPDGIVGLARTGIHLEDKGKIKVGDYWSSKNPTVIGHIDNME
ncbi:hypothetical protein LCGC14_2257140, partial [marine sediment metagenome]